MNKLTSCQVIVIQVGSVGPMTARLYFDEHGIKLGENYVFFSFFGHQVMAIIVPGLPQIVFTSHDGVDINAMKVAAEIKARNPKAIVLALTTGQISEDEMGALDGIVSKWSTKPVLVSVLVDAFAKGADRKVIRQLIKNSRA